MVGDNGDPDNGSARTLGCDAGCMHARGEVGARSSTTVGKSAADHRPPTRTKLRAGAQVVFKDQGPYTPIDHGETRSVDDEDVKG